MTHTHYPTPPSVYSLTYHAQLALLAAEQTLEVSPYPIGSRDRHGVRGLAAYILKHDGSRWSWPDICGVLYGQRTGHATAVGGANKWVGTTQSRVALDSFKHQLRRATQQP